MKAMVLKSAPGSLDLSELPDPVPGRGQVRVAVHACGVCRTDLHVVDGDLPDATLPIVPGHEIVGRVDAVGEDVAGISIGDRVGVPWLGHTCGHCEYCASDRENLCDSARFTGYTLQGGYAEYVVVDAHYCFALPGSMPDVSMAPLLCAGLIGYRSYRMTGQARRIGIYGFGAAAHIVAQVAVAQDREVYAFVRPGDKSTQEFALSLGARWAGYSGATAPVALDAAIIFAPVGALVPDALRAVKKGGVVVCAGIHMSDIPSFPYRILWGERSVRSVANLTRQDGLEFLKLAGSTRIETEVTTYPLHEADRALNDLRAGRINGAAVLEIRRD